MRSFGGKFNGNFHAMIGPFPENYLWRRGKDPKTNANTSVNWAQHRFHTRLPGSNLVSVPVQVTAA